MTSNSSATGLREDGAFGPYWRAVRHHPVLVGLILIATLVLTLVWLEKRAVEYEATSKILVSPVTAPSPALTGLSLIGDSVDPTRSLQTAATVLSSRDAAIEASRKLGAEWPLSRILENVEVNAEGDSNVIAVTATADSERAAMAAANAYTRAVLAVRKKELLRQVDVKLASYQRSLDRLGTGDAATATAASLNDSIAQLEQIKDGDDPNFSLLQAASKAETTGTPKNIVLVLGLLGGLVIGVGSALVLEQLDRRIRDEDGLTEAYPLPILTRVPYVLDTEGSPQLREAFRTLQVQLDLGAEKRQVVMFTSASAGDGKTMSAIELAKTLVASGFRVALLDFDLRKPDIGTRLGVNSDVLTLFGSSPHLNDALVEAPGHAGLFVFSTESRNGVAPMLEALFGRLPEMLAQAREIADVVIIDTAPLGRVSDALRVAAVADEILLVGRPGNTDRKDLLVARELMGHMNITPTGMVVVGGGSSSYGYYGDAVEPQPQSVAPAPERLNGDDRARRRARRNSVK